MAVTRSFKELVVEKQRPIRPSPKRCDARRRNLITPARVALLASEKAWTYPILGNEDMPVIRGAFSTTLARW
jgi:hypothetical protein